jgi:hypothetical protein
LAYAEGCYRYRPSSNGAYPLHQSSPTPGSQIMYPYGTHSQQGPQPAQPMQQLSRPSPPQTTWAVPQTQNQYYQMPRGQAMSNREDTRHLVTRTDIAPSHSTASGNTTFSSSMHGSGHLATTDYFPGVIDTSRSHSMHVLPSFYLTQRQAHGVRKFAKNWSRSPHWTLMSMIFTMG